MAKKHAEEKGLKEYVNSDSKRKAKYGDPWSAIAAAEQNEKEMFLPLTFLERRNGFPGMLNDIARALVRGAYERREPNPERLPEYRESSLPSLEQHLFSTTPIYKDLETVAFADALTEMEQKLGADNKNVKLALDGRSPADAAQYYLQNTKLEDVNYRKELWNGGVKAIEASDDPLIVMTRKIEPDMRALRKRYDDQVDAVERTRGAVLAKIRFARGGTENYPDATFTLRLSYGQVKGYTENGEGTTPAGTKLPYFTTIGGGFEHAADHNSKPPYDLPQSWTDAKPQLKLSTPLNVVETADIIGGNSGSPVLNTKGEVVGIIFDGDIQMLPGDFVYDDTIARAIQVDTRGIIEALRTIYHADRLVNELMGATGKPSPAGKK